MAETSLAHDESPRRDAAHESATARVRMLPSVRYVGVTDWWGRSVWVEQGDVRSGLRYTDGAVIEFAWGRAGLGARELGRAILQHATGETDLDDALCVGFVHDVIVRLPETGFELNRREVLAWLAEAH